MNYLNLNENKILLTISTLHILIENCPNAISEEKQKIGILLQKFNQQENLKIRSRLSFCWNSLIKFNKEIFFEFSDDLFSFFIKNFHYKDYDLSFSSVEFFYSIIEETEEEEIPCEKIQEIMERRINE